MSASQAGCLLDTIYGAALQPHLWGKVVDEILEISGAQSAWLSRLDPIAASGKGEVFNIDHSFQSSYFEYYINQDPISNVADGKLQRYGLITDQDRISKSELRDSEFYSDFMRPQDAEDIAMVYLGSVQTEVLGLNINWGKTSGGFDDRRLAAIRACQPHLARATILSRKVALSVGDESHASLFDQACQQPIIIVDGSRRILYFSRPAQDVVERSSRLSVFKERLEGSDGEAGRQLEHAISAACSSESKTRNGSLIQIEDANGRGLCLSILPTQLSSFNDIFGERLAIISLKQESFSSEALTKSERRLVVALKRGLTLKQIASEYQISYNTVRAQLSRIFEKTGLRRQVELLELFQTEL